MTIKKTKNSVSFTLGTISILIVLALLLMVILNDWNLSPSAAHLMGLILVGSMILSIVGFVFFLAGIKSQKGFKHYLAGILNLTSILMVLSLVFKW